jgi:hypothetical protein
MGSAARDHHNSQACRTKQSRGTHDGRRDPLGPSRIELTTERPLALKEEAGTDRQRTTMAITSSPSIFYLYF